MIAQVSTCIESLNQAIGSPEKPQHPPAGQAVESPEPRPPVGSSASRKPPEPAEPPAAVTPPRTAQADQNRPRSVLDAPINQLSLQTLEGMRIIAQAVPGNPTSRTLHSWTYVMEAVLLNRWTAEQETALEALREETERFAVQDGPDRSDFVMASCMLALAKGSRLNLMSRSTRPGERPPAAEFAESIAELESALDLLPQAAKLQAALRLDEMAGLLRGTAAMLLAQLARHGEDQAPGEPDADLLARARAHLALVPRELLDHNPFLRDSVLHEQIFGGGTVAGNSDAARIIDRNAEVFEASGAGLKSAQAAVLKARQSHDSADIASATQELRKVGLGLPPGHPDRAAVLIFLAEMQNMQAGLTGSSSALADAVSTAVEALRAAGLADAKAAVQRLISLFGVMLIQDQRSGPFRQAEEALRAALAATSAGDWPLRVTITAGLGAACSMSAVASDDQALRQAAWQAIADAERMLPEAEPTDQWFDAAWMVAMWATIAALYGHDDQMGPTALRLVGQMEDILAASPELAGRVNDRYDRHPAPGSDDGGPDRRHWLAQVKEALLSAPAGSAPREAPPQPEDHPPAEQGEQAVARAADLLGRGDRASRPRRPLARRLAGADVTASRSG